MDKQIVVKIRYKCPHCRRVYKRNKTELQFHDTKFEHPLPIELTKKILINGRPVEELEPHVISKLRLSGALNPKLIKNS